MIFLLDIVHVCLMALMAYVCGTLAQRQGRNPLLWSFAALLFGMIPIFILIFFHIRKKRAPKTSALQGVAVQELMVMPPLLLSPSFEGHFWYYLDSQEQQRGPMDFNEIEKAWEKRELSPQTFIWNEKMTEWKKIEEIEPLLEQLIRSNIKITRSDL